jgi:hypothetical protein
VGKTTNLLAAILLGDAPEGIIEGGVCLLPVQRGRNYCLPSLFDRHCQLRGLSIADRLQRP